MNFHLWRKYSLTFRLNKVFIVNKAYNLEGTLFKWKKTYIIEKIIQNFSMELAIK